MTRGNPPRRPPGDEDSQRFNGASMADPLMQWLAKTQKEQTDSLHALAVAMGRIDTLLKVGEEAARQREVAIAELKGLVASLESDRKTFKTVLVLTWGALSAFAAVVAWLFPH